MLNKMTSTRYNRNCDSSKDSSILLMMSKEKQNGLRSRLKRTIAGAPSKLEEKFINNEMRGLISCRGFRDLEKSLKPYMKRMERFDKKNVHQYISSVLLLDQLHDSLKTTKTTLPNKVKALDIGCGENWTFANSLLGFLENYETENQRDVTLEGIDPLLKKSSKKNRNLIPINKNVLDLQKSGSYDFILMRKMLSYPNQFLQYNVKPIEMNSLVDKCSDLLTENGTQVTIGPLTNGEYENIVQCIPKEKRKGEFEYSIDTGNELLDGIINRSTVYGSGYSICVSGK